MNESLVTRSGAPDTPYCDPTTTRVTIIPAPLEYSVCYMKGTRYGTQAILNMPPARGTTVIPWERLSEHTYVTIDLDALDLAERQIVPPEHQPRPKQESC